MSETPLLVIRSAVLATSDAAGIAVSNRVAIVTALVPRQMGRHEVDPI